MAQKQTKKWEAVDPLSSRWENILGVLAVLLVFVPPFFPDEKLLRPKMQVLELGLFGMVSLAGLRILLTSRSPVSLKKTSHSFYLALAIGIWVLVQSGLFLLATEKSLAGNELRRIFLGASAFVGLGWAAFQRDWIQRIMTAWGFSAGLLAIYGILQISGGMGVIHVPQMDRVMGTYGNPIFFAVFLVSSIFVTWAACVSFQRGWIKNILLGSLFVQGFALYHTQTRAAWIAFGVTLAFGFLLRSQKKKVPKGVFVLMLLGLGLFAYQTRHVWQRDQGHLLIWRDTVRMWAENPVAGVGLGAFHTRFPAYAQEDLKAKWPQGQTIINYAHNEYLQLLAETGLVGFVSFMGILYFLWRLVKNTLAQDPVLLALFLAASSILVQNLFSVDMRFGISFAMLFMIIGLIFSYQTPVEEKWPTSSQKVSVGFRFASAGLWLGFMGMLVFPKIMQPYRAQKEVNATPGFFNERLLDPAKSIQDLETLAAQYPHEALVLEKLAYVYAKEMKTTDDKLNLPMAEAALGVYQKLVEVDPSRVSAYNNMANISYTMGRHNEAISLWKKCVEIDPNFLDAHLNLGKTLYVRGDLKESAAHLEKVLELQPGNAEAIVYLKRMVE